jgi:hypothetical protein
VAQVFGTHNLDRFTFLLGGSDGEELFGPGEQ